MAATANTRLRDAALLRAINLQRYANSEVRAMLSVLNAADQELSAALAAAMERLPVESFTVRRLDAVLSGVWELNDALYRQLAMRTAAEMEALTAAELKFQAALFRDLLPVGQATVGTPAAAQVWAAARSKPFQGRLLADWFAALGAGRQVRIERALRTGYVQGATVDEMIRSLRGTRAAGYQDGLIQIDRRHAEAVVRTATAHTASVAREAFYDRNKRFILAEQWLSTLDTRTTDLCIVRDGEKYSVTDHEPLRKGAPPWLEGPGALHWNCRSVSVPVLNSAEILGFDLPPAERAAMNGVAAPRTTYKDWLAAQTAAVQDEVLGPTRGRMYRAGEMKFTEFFNDRGQLRRLSEL